MLCLLSLSLSFVVSSTFFNSFLFLYFYFKIKNVSAFNTCSGRGKHPEQAKEDAAAKGDVELAGGGNGFVAPSVAAAPAAAALPTSSSAKA